MDPWRDRTKYETGRKCRKTNWGNWCYDCNVDRIDRINGRFAAFEASLKTEQGEK